MIRHLRWKVVATNMLLISLVLLLVLAAVFFIFRDNFRKIGQQRLAVFFTHLTLAATRGG